MKLLPLPTRVVLNKTTPRRPLRLRRRWVSFYVVPLVPLVPARRFNPLYTPSTPPLHPLTSTGPARLQHFLLTDRWYGVPRRYGIGAQIMQDLGVRTMRLMTNNPSKYQGLKGYGLEVVGRVPLMTPVNLENRRYIETKRVKMGHMYPEDLVGEGEQAPEEAPASP
eukprot:6797491-Pyramimonas_sp.AAC.1